MSRTLAGKTAIVTGGGQGIGRGIARALAQQGAAVLVAGRTESTLCAVVESIRAEKGTADWHRGDITEQDTVDTLVRRACDVYGTVDILVNNAQDISAGPLLDADPAAFERAWRSGPMAALALMRACHPLLLDGGVVINLVSGVGIRWDMEGFGAYAAAKQALAALTRTAACEWGPSGIRVLGLMPVAATAAWQSFETAYPEQAADFVSRIPLRRIADPEAIGRAAALLCGPDASYITGSVVKVDGGFAP
ncbi:SDR family NAD(P)-dependent oxidoreductase [Streptomyces sp. NPDC057137]|uniref:SDR family NAD(P)-dependent oxidoreductase n=1 Tax=Streptomyces sp. NPDC057137 TaxID=3346030 RepID=UPI0036447734